MAIRMILLASCAAICASMPVYAQDAAPSEEEATENGEILVTARRREESITDVPVAITAFSGDTLQQQGVTKVQDLMQITPGLNVAETSTGGKARPIYELRGVFPNDVLLGQDQSVGVYVNEVYAARPTGTNTTMFDIENVQVLYGPQGTLFGRNTTGGAILISTKKPTDVLEGEAWAGISNYSGRTVGGMINLPASDAIQFRFGGQYEKRNGYTKNILTGVDLDDVDNYALRGSVRLKLGSVENVTVADYYRSRTNGYGGSLETLIPAAGGTITLADGHVMVLSGSTATLYPALPAAIAAQVARGPRQVAHNNPGFANDSTLGLTNTTTLFALDNLTLKNIFAYRRVKSANGLDSDKSALSILHSTTGIKQEQFSNEFQVQGTGLNNRLDWIAGAFFFQEKGFEDSVTQNAIGTANFTQTTNIFEGKNTSMSLFAQLTYELVDGLNFTAGGRYNWDTRQGAWNNPRLQLRGNPPVAFGTCLLAQAAGELDADRDCFALKKASFEEPTYTLTLDYHPTDSSMLYVTHRRGYRSGGFNGRATSNITATPFNSEIVTDIEVGGKANFDIGADGRFGFDVALYRSKYQDQQRTIVVPDPLTLRPTSVIVNAASSTIKGFEIKANLQPIRQLSVSGTWAYADGEYDRFKNLSVCPALNTPCTAAQRVLADGVNLPFGTAKNSATANVTITPIDNDSTGKIALSGSMSYRSKWFVQNEIPVLIAELPARTLFNLSLDWSNVAGTGIDAQLYAKNVTNKLYRASGLSITGSNGFANYYYGEPRIWGLNLRYKFGGN